MSRDEYWSGEVHRAKDRIIVDITCYCDHEIHSDLPESWYPKSGYLEIPCTKSSHRYGVGRDSEQEEFYVKEINNILE